MSDRSSRRTARPACARVSIGHAIVAIALAVSPGVAAAAAAAAAGSVPAPDAAPAILTIAQHERLLVVAPHPDGETLGAGGLIEEVLARGGEVSLLWITAGDGYVEAVEHVTGELRPRAAAFVAYGEQRIGEAHEAARVLAGAAPRSVVPTLRVLGFPDGGLRALLRDHWERTRPERSPTTGVDRPPYPEAVDAGKARYDGADLRRELDLAIGAADPTLIAFPDPADKHPDHHAAGLFTLLALDDWADTAPRHGRPLPRMLAYLVHWPGWPPGWDAVPEPAATTGALMLPTDLAGRGLERVSLHLAAANVDRKAKALAAHATQQAVMPELLGAFVRADEPFTVFSPIALEHLTASVERSLADLERGQLAPRRR